MNAPVVARTPDQLLAAFLAAHGDHYQIGSTLGEGASGFAHRAHDTRRRIDVCVKLFLKGIPPRGAARDWRITSTLKHPLVADTFTVEHFQVDGLAEPSAAVVSRLIPGSTLAEAIDRFRALEPSLAEALHDELVRQVGYDICTGVRVCHDAGVGHGDLTEWNVIVTRDKQGRRFGAVLIDFDNATYDAELRELVESDLIDKDVRALVRLLGIVTYGAKWHEGIQSVLKACTSARAVQEGLGRALQVTRGVLGESKGRYGYEHWMEMWRIHLAAATAGAEYVDASRNLMRLVAEDSNSVEAMESANADLITRIETDPNYPGMSVRTSMRDRATEDAATSLVD